MRAWSARGAAGCAPSARAWHERAPRGLAALHGRRLCSFLAFWTRTFCCGQRSPSPAPVRRLIPSLIASPPLCEKKVIFVFLNTRRPSGDVLTANQVPMNDSLPPSACHSPLRPPKAAFSDTLSRDTIQMRPPSWRCTITVFLGPTVSSDFSPSSLNISSSLSDRRVTQTAGSGSPESYSHRLGSVYGVLHYFAQHRLASGF